MCPDPNHLLQESNVQGNQSGGFRVLGAPIDFASRNSLRSHDLLVAFANLTLSTGVLLGGANGPSDSAYSAAVPRRCSGHQIGKLTRFSVFGAYVLAGQPGHPGCMRCPFHPPQRCTASAASFALLLRHVPSIAPAPWGPNNAQRLARALHGTPHALSAAPLTAFRVCSIFAAWRGEG